MQGEHFNVTLCKGPRGFGFSLVAAPTFSSDVSQVTSSATTTDCLFLSIYYFINVLLKNLDVKVLALNVSRLTSWLCL